MKKLNTVLMALAVLLACTKTMANTGGPGDPVIVNPQPAKWVKHYAPGVKIIPMSEARAIKIGIPQSVVAYKKAPATLTSYGYTDCRIEQHGTAVIPAYCVKRCKTCTKFTHELGSSIPTSMEKVDWAFCNSYAQTNTGNCYWGGQDTYESEIEARTSSPNKKVKRRS